MALLTGVQELKKEFLQIWTLGWQPLRLKAAKGLSLTFGHFYLS